MQGSNADWLKKAMVNGVKDGVCDVLGIYLNTVYDELGLSYDNSDPKHVEAAKHMEYLMTSQYKLNVPVLVSKGKGTTWGEASLAPDFEYGIS
jgi:DNA polymerase I-like protein with 3'-5' exonuclease and polymerase domains